MYMLYVIMIHCLLNEIDGHTSPTVFLQYLVLRRFRFRHFVIGFVNIWGIGIIRVILFQCIFYLYHIAIHVGCGYRHEACIVFRLMIVVWTVNFFPRKNSKKQHNYNVSKKVLPRTYTDIHARQNPNHPNHPNHPNQQPQPTTPTNNPTNAIVVSFHLPVPPILHDGVSSMFGT